MATPSSANSETAADKLKWLRPPHLYSNALHACVGGLLTLRASEAAFSPCDGLLADRGDDDGGDEGSAMVEVSIAFGQHV